MALSEEAVKIVSQGGKAAVILREIESLKLAIQSVAQQQAKINAHLCELETLNLRVKDAREMFRDARTMLEQNAPVLETLRDMFKELATPKQKKALRQRIASFFLKDKPTRRYLQDSDYSEYEDSDF